MIEPMLFVNFVENAFKHGNLSHSDAFIRITLTIDTQRLDFKVTNSLATRPKHIQSGGMGIQNIQQRLKLLYPDKHHLDIREEQNKFSVRLTLDYPTSTQLSTN
jgi:LytS/YehU family sensor histidine kinase